MVPHFVMEEKKVILFVDSSNLYHSLKRLDFNPSQVDYLKLFELITKRKNPTVRFYTAMKRAESGVRQQANQQVFHNVLKRNPNLSIHLGKLQKIHDDSEDIQIVVKALNFCKNCLSKAYTLIGTFRNNNKFKEKGVDVQIAVDLITLCENKSYDSAIILSGDADLVPAVKFVVSKYGPIIINAYFGNSSGIELRNACQNKQFEITKNIIKQCSK